jgi:hypothetical protein
MCVKNEWQWNSTNIFAFVWLQEIFHVTFTAWYFVGSSFINTYESKSWNSNESHMLSIKINPVAQLRI